MSAQLLETIKPVSAFVPIDTTGAGQDGDWVHFAHFRRCLIVLMQGAWAAGTSAVTVEQATTAAGGSAKALDLDYFYRGTALTDDIYAKTAIVSDTFTLPATANTITLLEVKAGDLDQMNDFTFIRVRCASPGASADLLAGLYIFGDPAYPSKPETQPTVIA